MSTKRIYRSRASQKTGIFYTSGLNNPRKGTWSLDRLQHIALPVITLCVISFALYSRYMRASMLDVINTDYVRTARAKGVSEWQRDHAARLPERVDPDRHGRRAELRRACSAARSSPRRSSRSTASATISSRSSNRRHLRRDGLSARHVDVIIIFNLIADILYGYLDPRIRYD